ncbi:MAG: hypothetical protein CM1200mP41_37300 [Gammaproteobacteria bacterium]|nr:MAG: hypothetical protein CM1200mP41_37300 [Gammaproteobacteria bacterium]
MVRSRSRWYGALENMFNILSALRFWFCFFFRIWFRWLVAKYLMHLFFGYIDWVEQVMVIFAFIGVAYCQREGGHAREWSY